MANSVRSRRVSIAAGALSLALVAPFVSPVADVPAAHAVEANAFDTRYTTGNFWDAQEAVVEGLTLEPGDQVAPTANTIFNWNFRNDNGVLTLIRPRSAAAFSTGEVDIPVRVTPVGGTAFNTTLRVNVVDSDPDAVSPAEQDKFSDRYTTDNFWNEEEAAVQGLTLADGTTVAPTANTIFNWNFRNDNGTLVVIRPQSATAFRTGNVDIPVRVTEGNGSDAYTTTLRLNVVDARTPQEWEKALDTRYPLDFEKSTSAMNVEGITLPEGVSVSKAGIALPTGWVVSNDGNTVRVTPPTTFKEGDFDLPISVNDGTDTFDATLKIAAKNPSETAGILGPLLGGLFGGGTGGGSGAGRLINVVITGNANPSNIGNNNGSPNVIITNNANPSVIITNNANPVITGNANDNFRENGSNNSVVVTGNANPVVTGNANPTVVITGNANNNGSNNSVIATGNANPKVVVTDNANFGLLGSSRKRNQDATEQQNGEDKGSSGSSRVDTNVDVSGGSSDPRCIASLVGLGLPLIALVPLALSNQLNIEIPGAAELNAQAARTINDTARQFGVAPEQLTAGAGAVAGLVAALIVVSAANTCVPTVRSVDVNVGRRPVEAVAAPVVETTGA